jgi:hypothetical protein
VMEATSCIVDTPSPPPPYVFCRGRGSPSSGSGGSPPPVTPPLPYVGEGSDLMLVGTITGSDTMNRNSSSHYAARRWVPLCGCRLGFMVKRLVLAKLDGPLNLFIWRCVAGACNQLLR